MRVSEIRVNQIRVNQGLGVDQSYQSITYPGKMPKFQYIFISQAALREEEGYQF